MLKADVLVDRHEFTVDVRPGGVQGQVDICWMGVKMDTRFACCSVDWAGVACSFRRQISGAVASGSRWGILLHLCGLIFWFGDIAVPVGRSAMQFTPLQKELVDIWLKYGQTGTAESALQAIERMVEAGGYAAVSS